MDQDTQNPDSSLACFVHARISAIQGDYLSANGKSRGARRLAVLRHAIMTPIGANADAWPLEFEGLPDALVGKGAEPSAGERAVHGAMTLYAFHQQGQSSPMHVRGRDHGLGNAVGQMVQREREHYENLDFGEMPRRFRALITAESMDETLHYARQLVQQLKNAGIPVDYARLAVQLYDLQNPYRADSVRLAWGRGYSFATKPQADDSSAR